MTEICSGSLTEVLQTVMSGSDACVLCFGQANQGKYQTLIGSDKCSQDLGLLPTAISWLYRVVQDRRQRQQDARFSVRVSALEVSGHHEQLNDLLADFSTNGETAHEGVSIKDEPVLGLQLQNLNELRAPTADRAAFYLDAALAARNSKTTEGQRNSHLFFTLHVYQYKVDSGKTGVAGGRSRLHLIDLGSGEKTTKSGRSSLTLPALGNVLLTVLQGQKYLPFRDSKVTQLLRDAIGCTSCRAISVLACVTADADRYLDTLNTLQIAGRLHRIRRQKKNKLGVGSQHSSGGESSSDAGKRKRLGRSASDPDCTSSSEQSCDTVIYLGDPQALKCFGTNFSDQEQHTTDGESSVGVLQKRQEVKKPMPIKASAIKTTPPSPRAIVAPMPQVQLPPNAAKQKPDPNAETWIDGPKAGGKPAGHMYYELEGQEQWIDGPKAEPSQMPSPQKSRPEANPPLMMDPLKREMIQKWVCLQEEQRMAETWTPSLAMKQTSSPPTPSETISVMDTSSEVSEASKEHSPIEMRDAAIQITEADIDFEILGLNAMSQQHYRWNVPDHDMRFLEDIAEENEENISSESQSARSGRSSVASKRSIAHQNLDMPGHRNEALAAIPNFDAASLQFLPDPVGGGLSCNFEHILSQDRLDVQKLDGFSLNSEQLDSLSLPATDQPLDEDMDNDEDLERAMAASLTSIRSHEILEKLKSEPMWAELKNGSSLDESRPVEGCPTIQQATTEYQGLGKLSNLTLPKMHVQAVQKVKSLKHFQGDTYANPDVANIPDANQNKTTIKSVQLLSRCSDLGPPDGAADANISAKHLKTHAKQKQTTCNLVCCSMANSGASSHISSVVHKSTPQQSQSMPRSSLTETIDSTKSEKLHKPTIPAIPKSVSREITSKLMSGVQPYGAGSTNFTAKPESSKIPAAFEKPSRLASSSGTGSLPKPGWGRRDNGHFNNAVKDKTGSTSQPMPAKQNKSDKKAKANNVAAKEKKSTASATTGGKSPLMNFLRSPTKSSKKTLCTTSASTSGVPNRGSCGYDSGHDSGIMAGGAGDSSSASPELMMSPYTKLTRPRTSQRSSSGHGSDNSSLHSLDAAPADSSGLAKSGDEAGKPPKIPGSGLHRTNRLPGFLSSPSGRSAKNRDSLAGSSGYESAEVKDTPANCKLAPPRHTSSTGSGSDTSSSARSPSTAMLGRRKVLACAKSQSAPQSPSGTQKPVRMHESQLVDERAETRRQEEMRILRRMKKQVDAIKLRQLALKHDLLCAKTRLGIPESKWSYELHAAECMEISNPGLVEALEQETRILEKRVVACQNHVMIVTVFDSAPSRC